MAEQHGASSITSATRVEIGAVIVAVVAICTYFVTQATRLTNIENAIVNNSTSNAHLKERMAEDFEDVMREFSRLNEAVGDRWSRRDMIEFADRLSIMNPEIDVPKINSPR